MLTKKNQRWIDEFCVKNARPPRILHIGNIANNAYNNAKILNSVGLDNDVICYDYYHIMGCPEWEDADLDGEIDDDFHPKWKDLNLNGFERPPWFAQGTIDNCICYLIAKRSGADCRRLWKQLGVDNLNLSERFIDFSYRKIQSLMLKSKRFFSLAPNEAFTAINSLLADRIGVYLSCTVASAVMFFWPLWNLSIRFLCHTKNNEMKAEEKKKLDELELGRLYQKLTDKWQINFPERVDKLEMEDIIPFATYIKHWKKLFQFYDIIIGYSTDPFIPLLAGVPYFAFEHGTLREIPYNNDSQGRRTAISYRSAKHVFVTNFDCLNSAEKFSPGKFTLINHPFDEDHGVGIKGFQELRVSLRTQLRSEFVFFAPARQDWVEGTGYADKANDVFFHALAQLRKEGYQVGAVCCRWGANVSQSQQLLEILNLTNYVLWVKPMEMIKFERTSLACEIVVDQFKLGSFGGVMFKALATGTPVLTYLDKKLISKQYPEVPPVINCSTSAEIFHNTVPLIESPQKLSDIGLRSRQWIKNYHSKVSTVNRQVEQFRQYAV